MYTVARLADFYHQMLKEVMAQTVFVWVLISASALVSGLGSRPGCVQSRQVERYSMKSMVGSYLHGVVISTSSYPFVQTFVNQVYLSSLGSQRDLGLGYRPLALHDAIPAHWSFIKNGCMYRTYLSMY